MGHSSATKEILPFATTRRGREGVTLSEALVSQTQTKATDQTRPTDRGKTYRCQRRGDGGGWVTGVKGIHRQRLPDTNKCVMGM